MCGGEIRSSWASDIRMIQSKLLLPVLPHGVLPLWAGLAEKAGQQEPPGVWIPLSSSGHFFLKASIYLRAPGINMCDFLCVQNLLNPDLSMFLKDTFPGDSNREAVSEEASGKLCTAPGG